MAASVGVFAGVTLLVTWQLRGDLQAQILRREAETLGTTIDLQLTLAEEELTRYGLGADAKDWFPLLLETSRLRGVVALRLFGPDGVLRDALPLATAAEPSPADWAALKNGDSLARLRPPAALELLRDEENRDSHLVSADTQLLEVLVPLREPVKREFGGAAQYWIDGTAVRREFAALDRSLWWRSGLAVAAGSAIVLGALAWAFRRLEAVNRELRLRGADLARANAEFSLAAKTSALGAITAHLIHGLKNPLFGLEGYVVGQADAASDERGDESRAAVETARRLRDLVNEVVNILREEQVAGSGFSVETTELVAHVQARVAPLAAERGVTLACHHEGGVALPSRRANLVMLVLDNLLRNACEATPRGRGVSLRACRGDGETNFYVEDEGNGLPAAVAERLFQPVASSKPGGGGIGLVISHQLARHAGGQLELVKSDADGCRFRLSMPESRE
jgi:signal transduction histidine kinase